MSNPQVVHAKKSFSARKRWKKCAISIHMSAGIGDTSSPAAEEGTQAHTVAEFYVCQHFGLAHRDFGQIAKGAECPDMDVPEGLDLKGVKPDEWNANMRRHGKAYRDYVISLIPAGEEAYVVVEQKVSIPSISPDLFGTADLMIWLPRLKRIIVVDYKYGYESVEVGTYEETNEQLAAYLVAGEEGLMQKGIVPQLGTLAVYQPRRVLQQPQQSLDVDRAWFGKERAKLQAESDRVDNNPGVPVPGDHCRYCKGKAKCPAVQNALQTAIAAHCGEKSVLDMPEDQLVQMYALRAGFKAFWEDVEERIKKLADAGHANLEIKERQGNRKWGDTKLAVDTFMALGRLDLLQPISLTDVMEKVPEAYLDGLIARGSPVRTIKLVEQKSPTEISKMFQQYIKKD